MKTCWQIDAESEQKGEWIEIDVPMSEVDKLSVAVGWNADKTSYTDYGRIKTVRVEVYTDDGEKKVLEHNATLEDKMGMQEIDLPNTKVGSELSGGKVRLVITDIYPGQDYPNLAVSEVLVHLKEMDASTTFTSPPPPLKSIPQTICWMSQRERSGPHLQQVKTQNLRLRQVDLVFHR